jgi:hypothetical protein
MILEIGNYIRLKDGRLAKVVDISENRSILIEIVEDFSPPPPPPSIFINKEGDDDDEGESGGGVTIGYINADDILSIVTISPDINIEEDIDHGK